MRDEGVFHTMKDIDSLEHGGGNFFIRHNERMVSLPDPRAQHYQWVLMALHLSHVPGTPGDLTDWQRALVFEHWCAAYDLPPFGDAQRLAYLVDNYRSAITYDLQAFASGLDLGELWRARRWRLLLDIIDRLPGHSWYSATVSMDEKHAKMMAESIAARQADPDAAEESKGPPLHTWTPEVAALTNVLDAVRRVEHAVIAAQHGKKAGEPPKAAPRPVTPLEKALKLAEFNRKKTRHESLVARVLPHKSRPTDPVH